MKRFILFGFILLAVAAAAFLLAPRQFVSSPKVFVLSDGSVLRYRGATYGTNHSAPTQFSDAMRFVPKPLRKFFPNARAAGTTTQGPTVMFWFERVGITRFSQWQLTLVTQDGFEGSCGTYLFSAMSATNQVEAHGCPAPRRERTLHLKIYDTLNGPAKFIGEFTVPNPAPLSNARWTSRPLPQTRSTGDFAATLLSLETKTMQIRSSGSLQLDETRARFRVTEHGAATTNWVVQRIDAIDAPGGMITPNRWGGPSGGIINFDYGPSLWPSEVYKLHVEFGRAAHARFASNELWLLRDIAVPTNGGFTRIEARTNLNGFQLCFHRFSRAGRSTPWGGSGYGATLDFDVMPDPTGYRFVIMDMQDDQGRKVSESGRSWTTTNYHVNVNLSNDVKSLTVTVALPKSRYLDFIAQPVLTNAFTGN
jgi:hypothetical protein